jgi:hypothetical protein
MTMFKRIAHELNLMRIKARNTILVLAMFAIVGEVAAVVLRSPVWSALLSMVIGTVLFVLAERRIVGYRLIIVLALLFPGAQISGQTMPFAEISTATIAVTFIALYIRKEWTNPPLANPRPTASQT